MKPTQQPRSTSSGSQIAIEVEAEDPRKAEALKWAAAMLRGRRIGLIPTLALRSIQDRYPVDMLRLREEIATGRLMTIQEARLRLVERQIGSEGTSDPSDTDMVRACLQRWIDEATQEESGWRR